MKARTVSLAALALVLSTALAAAHGGRRFGGDRGPGDCSPRHRAGMLDVAKRYIDIINARDVSSFPAIFSDDYRVVSTAGTFEGLPAFTGVMSALYAGLPDIHYTVDEVLVDGDDLIIRYRYSGTHTGNFLGLPPTGKTISCSGLEIDRVEGNRLVETHNFTDYHCLLSGLGAP